MVKKPKKPRKGFNRSAKEWEKSIATHIGKFIDGMKENDLMDLCLNAGLAYAGYETFKDWKGLLFGPISLKLATTSGGGTPPVAQIAGVAGLLSLGLSFAAPTLSEWVTNPEQGLIPSLTGKKGPLYWNWATGTWETLPPGLPPPY